MNAASLFWGVLLTLIGILWLLSNAGLLPANFWIDAWKLWPVLLILLGISLLFSRGGNIGTWFSARLVLIIVAAVGFFGWIFTANQNASSASQSTKVSEALPDNITRAEFSIKFGATKLLLSNSNDKLVEGEINSFGSPKVSIGITDGVAVVNINQIENGPFFWGRNNNINMLDLKISNKIPINLNLDSGASKIEADLSSLKLQNLNINSGAAAADIKVGEQTEKISINISSGASSYELQVPGKSGLKILDKSGVSGNNFKSLNLKRDGGTWTSDGYESSSNQIEITFSAGASSLNITRY